MPNPSSVHRSALRTLRPDEPVAVLAEPTLEPSFHRRVLIRLPWARAARTTDPMRSISDTERRAA